MSQEWNPPDWLAQAAAWAASLVAAGAAKPAWDWWRERGREQREAKKDEVDAATELREEMRKELRTMRADIAERDGEIEVVRRELYELLARLATQQAEVATLKAENHDLRATDHRLRAWLAGFYATLQMRWKQAGLPLDEFPSLPEWVTQSPDGPTASFREPTP